MAVKITPLQELEILTTQIDDPTSEQKARIKELREQMHISDGRSSNGHNHRGPTKCVIIFPNGDKQHFNSITETAKRLNVNEKTIRSYLGAGLIENGKGKGLIFEEVEDEQKI